MRSVLLLLPVVGGSLAANIPAFYGSGNAPQVVLNGLTFDASPSVMEGFSLDINEERLVKMEGQDPVRMTELEKVRLRPPLTDVGLTRHGCSIRSRPRRKGSTSLICRYLNSILQVLCDDGVP